MTHEQAKEILLLYRPGSRIDRDVAMQTALALAQVDPALKQWFDRHREFQQSMRAGVRAIPVPSDLKNSLLLSAKIVRPRPWWRSPVLLAAAAMVVLLLVLRPLWQPGGPGNQFADFAAKMSSTVQREYRMDVESADLKAVRAYMAGRGSPADFVIPGELQGVELAGGGFLRWRDKPVSMVCFRKADREMSYLFVAEKSVVKDPPPKSPVRSERRGLATVAWTQDDKVYLLANPP